MRVFDIVSAIIDGYSDDASDSLTINRNKIEILEEYCDIIDDIMLDWGGTSFDSQVVGKKRRIVITIEISALTADETNKLIFDLIERTVMFAVGNTVDNNLRVDFVFPSVWEAK